MVGPWLVRLKLQALLDPDLGREYSLVGIVVRHVDWRRCRGHASVRES